MLLFSGVCVLYILRVNMSVAAVKMKDDLGWTESQKGLVLSAFYWGYAIGQLPASRLGQYYGAKWLFGLSVLIPSILSLLVPVASRSSFGMALFIRVLIGFFESAGFPSAFHFFPTWLPLAEKTFLIPFIVSGTFVGMILGFSISGVLANCSLMISGEDWGGWPSIFYVFGILGLLWFPIWAYAAYESPEMHPSITAEEILLLNHGKDMPYQGLNATNERDLNDTLRPLMYEVGGADIEHPDIPLAEVTGPFSPSFSASSAASSSAASSYAYNPLTASQDEKDSALTHRANSRSTDNAVFRRAASIDRMGQLSKEEWQVLPTDMFAVKGNQLTKAELTARTPWKAFFTDHVALAILTCAFTNGWIGFTLMSEMPSYLTDILGFDLDSAGIYCIYPYLALFFSTLIFARVFDYLQRERAWSNNDVRVTAMFIALLGSGMGLVVCGFLDAKFAAYTFMVLTQVFYAAASCGISCIYTDVAPLYSSSLNSLGNTVSAIAGLAGPIVVSAFLSAFPGIWGWRLAFMLTGGMCVACFTLWYLVIKSEIRPILNTPKVLKEDNQK